MSSRGPSLIAQEVVELTKLCLAPAHCCNARGTAAFWGLAVIDGFLAIALSLCKFSAQHPKSKLFLSRGARLTISLSIYLFISLSLFLSLSIYLSLNNFLTQGHSGKSQLSLSAHHRRTRARAMVPDLSSTNRFATQPRSGRVAMPRFLPLPTRQWPRALLYLQKPRTSIRASCEPWRRMTRSFSSLWVLSFSSSRSSSLLDSSSRIVEQATRRSWPRGKRRD